MYSDDLKSRTIGYINNLPFALHKIILSRIEGLATDFCITGSTRLSFWGKLDMSKFIFDELNSDSIRKKGVISQINNSSQIEACRGFKFGELPLLQAESYFSAGSLGYEADFNLSKSIESTQKLIFDSESNPVGINSVDTSRRHEVLSNISNILCEIEPDDLSVKKCLDFMNSFDESIFSSRKIAVESTPNYVDESDDEIKNNDNAGFHSANVSAPIPIPSKAEEILTDNHKNFFPSNKIFKEDSNKFQDKIQIKIEEPTTSIRFSKTSKSFVSPKAKMSRVQKKNQIFQHKINASEWIMVHGKVIPKPTVPIKDPELEFVKWYHKKNKINPFILIEGEKYLKSITHNRLRWSHVFPDGINF
jgi:hypothetical protein